MADQVLMPNQTTHGHPAQKQILKEFWVYVPFFHSSSHSIMLCYRLCESGPQRLFKLISFTFSKTRPIRQACDQTNRQTDLIYRKTKNDNDLLLINYNCRRPLPLTHVKATYDHIVMSPKLVRSYLQKTGNFKVIKKSSNAHCQF